MVTSVNDTNGCLLYPDGAPRFRAVFVNGGYASRHGRSLGEEGRQRFRDFFARGGSYTGVCAGANLASSYPPNYDVYFHIWPGSREWTRMEIRDGGWVTDMSIPTSNTGYDRRILTNYFNFGGNNVIENVFHNGGPFATNMPASTEVLARYLNVPDGPNNPPRWAEGEPSVWAWKRNSTTGRMVVTGSHPESASCANPNNERCQLMASILLYALDGQGDPQPIKTGLSNRVLVPMTAPTERVGDRQYHYFSISLPSGANNLHVELTSSSSQNLDLFLSQDQRPIRLSGSFDYRSTRSGPNEFIGVDNPGAGTWFVGVYGNHSVLNGVPYNIRAVWDAPATTGSPTPPLPTDPPMPTTTPPGLTSTPGPGSTSTPGPTSTPYATLTPTPTFPPAPTHAPTATPAPFYIGGNCPFGYDDVATIQGTECIFFNTIESALFVASIILFLMLLLGGFAYLTAAGDPKRLQSAQTLLTYAIIGFVIVVLSFVILYLIGEISGADIIDFRVTF